MINFSKEINNYKKISRLSKDRFNRYLRCLYHFCDFLAEQLHCNPNEVNLDRVYQLKNGDRIIAYKPIDAAIIDHYLMNQVKNGFSILESSTLAIKSFFRFLTNNRNFPNIVSNEFQTQRL